MKKILVTALLATFAVLPHQALAADPPEVAAKPSVDPIAVANALLDDMDAGRFDAVHARFLPQMAASVTVEQLKGGWISLPQQVGKFLHREPASVNRTGGLSVVTVPIDNERINLVAIVGIDEEGRIASFHVSPAPPPPAPVRNDLPSREVLIAPANRTELPGTLLFPKGKGPFPAVVFVHGSGPVDRDETVGGTRVFRDIAEGLADSGIASLRYEKRTHEHPGEFVGRAYTVDDETTNDALAAIALLKTQPDVDPKRIFVVGHSLGAMMAPRIAQRAPGLAGLVLLAVPARHLQYLVLDQVTWLSEHDPVQGEALALKIPGIRTQMLQLDNISPRLGGDFPMLEGLPASYWRDLAGYNQVLQAQALHLPMLIEQGDRDYQVTAPDWETWQRAFAHDSRVVIHHHADLNHLFVAGKGLSLPSEYFNPGHVDAGVITEIANWIRAH